MKRISKILALVSLVFLLCACSSKVKTDLEGETQNKYMVYFSMEGANCSIDEAKTKIRKLITDAGYGYTEYDTFGAYVNEDKQVIENDTLVYMLIFIKEEDVKDIITKAKKELNLKSVLYEVTSVYNGFVE